MNVYDFDKTIYKKDSTVSFYLFCLRRNPFLLRYIFTQGWHVLLYRFGTIGKTKFKEGFFSFLKGIGDVDAAVSLFWEKNSRHINAWYRNAHRSDDVVISASPSFLLRPICEELKIAHLICSEVDKQSGKFLTENCYGEEKAKRFTAQFGDVTIERFYSDSVSDTPMASMAKEAYVVRRGQVLPWGDCRHKKA